MCVRSSIIATWHPVNPPRMAPSYPAANILGDPFETLRTSALGAPGQHEGACGCRRTIRRNRRRDCITVIRKQSVFAGIVDNEQASVAGTAAHAGQICERYSRFKGVHTHSIPQPRRSAGKINAPIIAVIVRTGLGAATS